VSEKMAPPRPAAGVHTDWMSRTFPSSRLQAGWPTVLPPPPHPSNWQARPARPAALRLAAAGRGSIVTEIYLCGTCSDPEMCALRLAAAGVGGVGGGGRGGATGLGGVLRHGDAAGGALPGERGRVMIEAPCPPLTSHGASIMLP
jgi:hypothetical protein